MKALVLVGILLAISVLSLVASFFSDHDKFYSNRLEQFWYSITLTGSGYDTQETLFSLVELYTKKYGAGIKTVDSTFGHDRFTWVLTTQRIEIYQHLRKYVKKNGEVTKAVPIAPEDMTDSQIYERDITVVYHDTVLEGRKKSEKDLEENEEYEKREEQVREDSEQI